MKKGLVFLMCVFCTFAYAQNLSNETVIKTIHDVSSEFRDLNLSKEKNDILFHSLNRIFTDTKFVELVKKQAIQLGLDDNALKNKNNRLKFINIMLSILNDLNKQGMKYATTEYLEIYFSRQIKILENLSPKACRAIGLGYLISEQVEDEFRSVETAINNNMSFMELQRYWNHLTQLRLKALHKPFIPSKLSESELATAAHALKLALMEELKNTKNPEEIQKAFTNPSNASDKSICDASILTLKAYSNGSGLVKELKMRLFLEAQ